MKCYFLDVRAPIRILPIDNPNSSICDSSKETQDTSDVTITFENPEGLLMDKSSSNEPFNCSNNRIDRYYTFHNNAEHPQNSSMLVFSFGQQMFKFPILSRDNLNKIGLMPPISVAAIKEFLSLLKENWMTFIINELSVPKSYLFEFASIDLRDGVERLLPRRPATGYRNQIKVENRLFEIEDNLVRMWSDLKRFKQPDSKDRDTKSIIVKMCEQIFTELYEDEIEAPKRKILSILTSSDEDGDDEPVECGGLTDGNERVLAYHLMAVDHRLLIEKMKFAQKRYKLNKALMTNELADILGIEILDGGEDLPQ